MNDRKNTKQLRIENAKLIFKNFQGKRTDYNAEGNRNFGVIIDDPEFARVLEEEGWKIRKLPPRGDDPESKEILWVKVKVKYGDYPPIATLITSGGKIRLDEETIGQLDWSRIRTCDVVISPYHYPSFNGNPAGIAAYLKAIYVTVDEDEFEMKYRDIPYMDDEFNE